MLLKKANTITTPTAYSDGFLHSVKPEVIYGDDIVTNGDFNNGITGWSGSAVVVGGQLIKTSGGLAYQSIPEVSGGKLYKIIVDVELSVSSLKLYVGGTQVDLPIGVNTFYVTSAGSNNFVGFNNGYDSGTSTGSIINSIQVFEDISADFTFTRNSSATRVNELGYIEDVQIIGGELVSNGDFEEIGSELVTNGSFDENVNGWVNNYSGSVISWDNGTLKATATSNDIFARQNGILQTNKVYKVTFKAKSSNTTQTIKIFNTVDFVDTGLTFDVANEWQNFTYYLNTLSGASLHLIIGQRTVLTGDTANFDNVSVKEVGQDWTFGNGWTMGDGKAVFSDTANGDIRTQVIFTAGNKYRINLSVSDLTSGTAFFALGDGASNNLVTYDYYANGDYTFDVTAINGAELRIYATTTSSSSFSIDNVSVKEVTDDTNLPRINYEGFAYENGLPVPYSGKGHLLLEPQTSQILPYSEDFSTYAFTGIITRESGYLAPDGTNTAYKITNGGTGAVYEGAITIATTTRSIYARSVSGTGTAQLMSHYSNTNNTFTLTEQWQRFEVNSTTSPTGADNFYAVDFRGSGTLNEIIIWGANATNDQTYATSYIPTNGTAVTRLGETCNNATQSFPSEGVLYAEIAALAIDGTYKEISLSDGTTSNRIELRFGATLDRLETTVRIGGVVQFTLTSNVSSILDFHKAAIRYQGTDFSLWIDGVQVGTATSATAFPDVLASLQFDSGAGSSVFYGKTKMVATFPYLSNNEMECLTGEGYGTFEALAAAYSYTIK